MNGLPASRFIASPPIQHRAPLDVGVQLTCYAAIFFYAIFFQFTRAFGSVAFGLVVVCLLILWSAIPRWYVQRPLLWFALLGLIYVFLSVAGLLHWNTLLFQRGAIVQQCTYIFLLPLLVPVFAYYHERTTARDPAFIVFDNIVLAACIISKLIYSASIHSLSGLGVIQFFNVEALFAFFIVRRVYQAQNPSIMVRLVVVALFAATAGSFQSLLVALFLVGILFAPEFGRVGLLCFIGGLVTISIVAMPLADTIWQADPNTGIRLFFWRDAFQRIVDSWGVGQGFGTETIRPLYQLSITDVQIASLDQAEFILVGSHNAFIDAGYRMGVIGFLIMIFYVGSLFRSAMRTADPARAFDFYVCALLFVALMVNVGLASINFLFGTSFLMGWLAFRSAIGFANLHGLATLQLAGTASTKAATVNSRTIS